MGKRQLCPEDDETVGDLARVLKQVSLDRAPTDAELHVARLRDQNRALKRAVLAMHRDRVDTQAALVKAQEAKRQLERRVRVLEGEKEQLGLLLRVGPDAPAPQTRVR